MTCLLISFCVGFILDGFSSSSGMMASVSFDAISPPIDPPFAVPPAVATALMTYLDDLRNFFQMLLNCLKAVLRPLVSLPMLLLRRRRMPLCLPYSGLVNDLSLPILLLSFRSLPSTARGSHLPLNQLGSHLPLNQVGRSCFKGECDPGLGANVTPHFVWEAQ